MRDGRVPFVRSASLHHIPISPVSTFEAPFRIVVTSIESLRIKLPSFKTMCDSLRTLHVWVTTEGSRMTARARKTDNRRSHRRICREISRLVGGDQPNISYDETTGTVDRSQTKLMSFSGIITRQSPYPVPQRSSGKKRHIKSNEI